MRTKDTISRLFIIHQLPQLSTFNLINFFIFRIVSFRLNCTGNRVRFCGCSIMVFLERVTAMKIKLSKRLTATVVLAVFTAAIGIATLATSAPPRPRRARPRAARRATRRQARRMARFFVACRRAPRLRTVPLIQTVEETTVVVKETSPEASDSQETSTTPSSPSDVDKSFASSTPYKVLGVQDNGLTVVLKIEGEKTQVRMIGVAMADFGGSEKNRNRPASDMFLDNLLRGESVYVVYDSQLEEQDEDGNYIAYLHRAPDGLPINLEVIRQGLGVTDDSYSFEEKSTFHYYQNRARKVEKGVWAKSQAPPPKEP